MSEHAELYDIAKRLMAPGRGILAADESVSTMNKRLAAVKVDETAETRRKYRELLFTAPEIEKHLSGVILFDASFRNSTDEGIPFPDVLIARGIIPGIKVDKGTAELHGFPGEMTTYGLDGLGERLIEYADLGAQFTKWRAMIVIGKGMPSEEAIALNAVLLAQYAALAQAEGLVPIIEPEVLMHGDHDLARAEDVTMKTLQIVFATLREYRVDLKGVILKTSMVLAGDNYKKQTPTDEVADATLRTLHMSVPHDVAGIVFLSGGQSPVRATENLNAITKLGPHPWPITFSFSRAIEEPVLAAWKGEAKNVKKAQQVLLHRLAMNAKAREGTYAKSDES